MGKWTARDSHRNYIDAHKASRPLLSMMTKIRATQTLGAALTGRGNHARAYELYKKTINEMLADKMKDQFSYDQVRQLHEAMTKASQAETAEQQAWSLRETIDTVYDHCISDFNTVDTSKPPILHSRIKDVLNSASENIHQGNMKEGLKAYTSLLKQIKSNTAYRNSLTPASLRVVTECIETVENCDDVEQSTKKARESLDRIYNEIRLPDVYSPSAAPQTAAKGKERLKKQGLLMIDFRQIDGSLFPYNLQSVDDTVMKGESSSHVEHLTEEQYLKFHGSVSRVNRGGFASFRIVPLKKEEMQKVFTRVKGISICVKNLGKINKRYKFQLANEAHLKSFNWQSEFVVDDDNDFQTIYLDIGSFWPTMFGHVLSAPGNVDFSKVDCMGIIISHVTVDGKENPDFIEGNFGLAVRSISIVNEP